MSHTLLTLEEAGRLTLNAKAEGVPFNVPITFHLQYLSQWSAILEGSRHLLDGFVAAAAIGTVK